MLDAVYTCVQRIDDGYRIVGMRGNFDAAQARRILPIGWKDRYASSAVPFSDMSA